MFGYNYLKNFLQEEGFRMNEEDGHFSFKFQGSTYVAFKNESTYLQIVLICNTGDIDRSHLLEVCNSMNRDRFVVKFVAMQSTVWCSYEFKPSNETSSDDFENIFLLLDKASDEMFEKLRG